MIVFTDKSDDAGRLTELVYTDATPEEIREFEWIYGVPGSSAGSSGGEFRRGVPAGSSGGEFRGHST